MYSVYLVFHKCTPLSPIHTLTQGFVETGEVVHQITTQAPTFTVAWHPKKNLLAYACDDKVGRVATYTNVFSVGKYTCSCPHGAKHRASNSVWVN